MCQGPGRRVAKKRPCWAKMITSLTLGVSIKRASPPFNLDASFIHIFVDLLYQRM